MTLGTVEKRRNCWIHHRILQLEKMESEPEKIKVETAFNISQSAWNQSDAVDISNSDQEVILYLFRIINHSQLEPQFFHRALFLFSKISTESGKLQCWPKGQNKKSNLLINKAHKTTGNTEVWLVHRCDGFLRAIVASNF